MRNLKVKIAYNGSAYHGFQLQDNGNSIQGEVQKALRRLLFERIGIFGCSRTDTNVHAREFYFNFHTDNAIPCDGFIVGLNTLLPSDIVVLGCEEVDENFHARFDAKAKTYEYLIHNARFKDPFLNNLAFHYPYKLDADEMTEHIQAFVGEHDFRAFCKAETLAHLKTTVREIFSGKVTRDGDFVRIELTGSGFLHNMVRIIVGTLIYAQQGKYSFEDLRAVVSNKKRSNAGITAPAHGLYLKEVIY